MAWTSVGILNLVNDTQVAALVKSTSSTTRTAVARLATRVTVGFDISSYISGNGTTDDTAGLKSAITEAVIAGASAINIPPYATLKLSAAIDLKGLSVIGGAGSKLVVDPASVQADWKITSRDADVVMLYAKGHNDWRVENVTVDCSNRRVKAMSAWGGNGIKFLNNHVINSASAAIQFMGSNEATDAPVVGGLAQGNTVEGSYWACVVDGECTSVNVSDNIFIDSVQRHVSIDPNESYDPTHDVGRGIVVSNNVMKGRRDMPAGWAAFWPGHFIGGAIESTQKFNYVNICGNSITDWTSGEGIRLDAGRGLIVNNQLHVDAALTKGSTALRITNSSAVIITGNVASGYTTGFGHSSDCSDCTISENRFNNTTNKYSLTEPTPGGMVIGPNYLTGEIKGRFAVQAGVKATESSSALSVPNVTATAVPFTTEDWDDRNYHNTSTNNSRLTIPVVDSGHRVTLVGTANFVTNSTGYRELRIAKNGTAIKRVNMMAITARETAMEITVSDTPVGGDYYELHVQQSSGGSLSLFSFGGVYASLELTRGRGD